MHQRLEGGDEQHEHCDIFTVGQRFEVHGERVRKRKEARRAPISLHRWARFIGRQVQRCAGAFELLLPIRKLLVEQWALQSLSLPGRIIAIADWQRLPRSGLTVRNRIVGCRQFIVENSKRPGVAHNVVRCNQQHMVLGA